MGKVFFVDFHAIHEGYKNICIIAKENGNNEPSFSDFLSAINIKESKIVQEIECENT